MNISTKKLPKGEMEITVGLEHDEISHDLERAAQEISKERPIDGYRPGKAGYEAVKKAFGEQVIYEAALPTIVRRTYVKAVKDNDLKTFGEPEINVTKLAPGNPVEYTATVALLPEITKMAEIEKIKVDTKEPKVEEKDVDGTVEEISRMQTKEVRRPAGEPCQEGDKLVVDMDLSLDKVPLDGGQARGHAMYLDQEYYIPGMKDKVVGMKEGETREFELKFPKDHYQKNVAGRMVEFKVTAKEVHELQHPELNDEFAKSLGQESMEKLRALLKDNILQDRTRKEQERVDIAILEAMVDKTRFGEIPDKMVNMEIDRMLHELKHDVNGRGLEFEDYLANMNKTLEQLKLEMTPQAMKRVKTAILMRAWSDEQNVDVQDAEIAAEVEQMMNHYAKDAEAQQTIRSEEYQDYIRTTIRNRKAIELMREKANVVKKK